MNALLRTEVRKSYSYVSVDSNKHTPYAVTAHPRRSGIPDKSGLSRFIGDFAYAQLAQPKAPSVRQMYRT